MNYNSLFMNYKVVNTNYMGRVIEDINHLKFRSHPTMAVIKCTKGTLIVFKNKKFRLMGVKEPLSSLNDLPLKVQIDRIISKTIVADYGSVINLYKFPNDYFEPEIFPAMTLKEYLPLCTNIFSSGKIVITGVKTSDSTRLIDNIIHYIKRHLENNN